MAKLTPCAVATHIARHNAVLQLQIAHKEGKPIFNHLKAIAYEHQVDQTGAIVREGTEFVYVCDVSDPDLPPAIRAALETISDWADGLEAGQPTPEQADRTRREKEAAEAKAEEARLKEAREAEEKAKADG